MCFSATASFAIGSVMTATGVASVVKAKPHERLFALIPSLFGIQQIIEGFQWLAEHPSPVCTGLGYGYLFFAFLVWPIYIPTAAYLIETDAVQKRQLRYFIFAGVAVALFLLAHLLLHPLNVLVYGSGIQYDIPVPYTTVWLFVYAIVVSGSCLISSDRYVRWFGAGLLVAGAVSYFVFNAAFYSVWCFFASALSLLVAARVLQRR